MAETPAGKCGYTWPEDHEVGDDPDHQSCCWRDALDDTDRCAWHADPDETDEKTIDALRDARVDADVREQTSPYGELLDGAILKGIELEDELLLDRVALRDADLSDADLGGADLSDADLLRADLSDAHVGFADLSDAGLEEINLTDADLSDASLGDADLSDADLFRADLSDAFLFHTDLSNTDLRGVTVTDTDFREAEMENVAVSGATSVDTLREENDFDSADWDATARAYHNLKTAFSDHGLVGKARDMHVHERDARRSEVEASEGQRNTRYLGSLASRYFTGYGVRPATLALWMLGLFAVSTLWYLVSLDGSHLSNVSYSVLAFTVAPPRVPSGSLTQFVVMVETFFGTLSIVLLGYVLGNRERF
jgi:uncharacterized protein YjbI with pentapeptide repeats